jgi:alkylation response protein AidB-like acyl-CoA dehydrogenase
MALVLNEEQQLLRDSAKDFLNECSPVSLHRELRDSGREWSEELWAGMADMGWAGIVIPEAYGGLEFGYLGAGLLVEECGRTLATSPLVSSALVCASLISGEGSEQQKSTLLPAMASGERILALAWREGVQADPAATELMATADGDSFVLQGIKAHVTDGAYANAFIVSTRTGGVPGERDGLSLFLVERGAEGVEIESTTNADNHRSAHVRFDSVKVGADSLLGELGQAWTPLGKALNIGAVGLSAELLGIAEESFQRTIEYLKERKQFGVAIGSFQALHHRAAILFCELHLCRSLLLKALEAIDEDSEDLSLLASGAKTKCGRVACLAVNEAVQMHGGIGMTDEYDIGFFMKRAAAARQEYGDEYYHSDRFARIRGF